MPTRRQLANAIRILSMDAVQQANSGHPGMPMGMADIAEVLWRDFLQHNPKNPAWPNRDRFVLSNGHGSMLQYALLHLSGYDLSIDDLKNFRQLHSKTPGHPELGYTPGVETTTGPLGQGLANAVGMALAERILAAQFNRESYDIVNHYTYVFLGDGCLMEGISHEVCSLAGTLKLAKLIAFWDDNGISIDGQVRGWFTDDTPKRFEAYGWHVVSDVDGHDAESIRQAILAAQAVTDKPSLICCRTIIGYGAPVLAGHHKVHGAPLGQDEIAATRHNLGWSHTPFTVPQDIYQAWDAKAQGTACEQAWQEKFAAYGQLYPDLAKELLRRLSGELPTFWEDIAFTLIHSEQDQNNSVATRKASQHCLEAFGGVLPELLGGSADLTHSNLTDWSGSKPVSGDNPAGNYIYYGVREFGMAAIMNGIAVHGGFIPYGGTFLTFVDYARNAVRMAALMKQRVIHVFTHDSIGLGEDGPTHQPIEHISMLRMTPNVSVWRPCDEVETTAAWYAAISKVDGPTCLILSRQNLRHQKRDLNTLLQLKRGGYILKDCAGTPDLIIIATGSEVCLAVAAAEELRATEGRHVRVVSMPSTDVFAKQDLAYQESVLPRGIRRRVAIEAAASDFWYKYVGHEGIIIGLDRFGESAPAEELYKFFGFTVDKIVKKIETLFK
jgi:transketolase